MNKKFALFLACCVVGGLAASCNDTVEWGFQEENCLEGTVVCDSNAVKTCKNGEYEVTEECGSTKVCDVATKTCVDKPISGCIENTYQCSTNNLQVCKGGQWQLAEACGADKTCNAAVGKCDDNGGTTCTEGDTRCDGDKIATCGADGTYGESVACANEGEVCITGDDGKAACGTRSETCEPGCVDDILTTCDENGAAVQKPCGEGETCGVVDGQPACVVKAACVEGQQKCEGDQIVTCGADGQWGDPADCETDGEVCSSAVDGSGACVAPMGCDAGDSTVDHGAKRCNDSAPQICQNGVWITQETCAEPTVCDAGECVTCINDDTKCETSDGEEAKVHTVSKCVDHEWIVETEDCAAEGMVCAGKTCGYVRECTDDDPTAFCTDDNKYLVHCIFGTSNEMCPNGTACNADTARCEKPKTCGNSALDAGEVCDGTLFGDQTCATETGNDDATGNLTCINDCTEISVMDCYYCGDYYVNVDAGEECDKMFFAEGKRVCPEGKVFATGKTDKDITCSDTCSVVIPDGVCVDKCTESVCTDGDIQVCNIETGVMAPSAKCTNDPNAVNECASTTECKPFTCKDGFHNEAGVCVADCTADICLDGKIRVCGEDGKLAPETNCTNDPNAVNACASATACSTEVICLGGYHEKDGVCVENCKANVCAAGKLQVCGADGKLGDATDCALATNAATMACNAAGNACVIATCAEDYELNAEGTACVAKGEPPKSCKDKDGNDVEDTELGCSDATTLSTCDKGTWSKDPELITNCFDAHGTAICDSVASACKVTACNEGYEPNATNTACVAKVEPPKSCKDKDGKDVANGDFGCETETKYSECEDGAWVVMESCVSPEHGSSVCSALKEGCEVTCNEGYKLNAEGKACEFVTPLHTTIEACSFVAVNGTKAYGRVMVTGTGETDPSKYETRVVCGADPTQVNAWTAPVAASQNAACTTGEEAECGVKDKLGNNVEFVADLSGKAAGTHTCVFEARVNEGSWYLCGAGAKGWVPPVVMEASTDATGKTQSVTVSGGSTPKTYTESWGDGKKDGTGYAMTYTHTLEDGVSLSSIGNVETYSSVLGVTLTGKSSYNNKITISDMGSVGRVEFAWVSYNPTGGSGKLYVKVGEDTQTLTHEKETNGTFTYDFNDSTATSIEIYPESGTQNADHRIHIGTITWTSM